MSVCPSVRHSTSLIIIALLIGRGAKSFPRFSCFHSKIFSWFILSSFSYAYILRHCIKVFGFANYACCHNFFLFSHISHISFFKQNTHICLGLNKHKLLLFWWKYIIYYFYKVLEDFLDSKKETFLNKHFLKHLCKGN